jgi:hypothetical protein
MFSTEFESQSMIKVTYDRRLTESVQETDLFVVRFGMSVFLSELKG